MAEPILIIVDLETTGKDPKTADIVQIGAIAYVHDTESWSVICNQLVNPGRPIPAEASAIHGITDEMVKYAPDPRTAVLNLSRAIEAAADGRDVLVSGYNCKHYDLWILGRYGVRVGAERVIDAMHLAARYYNRGGMKLGQVYKTATGKDPTDAHSAVADCVMTLEILHAYMSFSNVGPSGLAAAMAPALLESMPFGKHKGVPMAKVPKDYVRYCLRNFDNLSPDLEYTLRYYA
jgi:DNA polymerase III epsilon subunit-like protein